MPNGRRRQSNTRHANRQRNLQSVRAEAVLDEAPPVVIQAEAIPAGEVDELKQEITGMEKAMEDIARAAGVPEEDEYFGHYRLTINQIEELDDEKRTTQRVAKKYMDKYEKAKAGTLLGFQEVEIEDQEKEINDLTYMLEKAMDKLQKMKEQEKNLLKAGEKAFFLYQIVKNTDPSEGAIIHLGGGRMVKVLTDEEADRVRESVTEERVTSCEEFLAKLGLSE